MPETIVIYHGDCTDGFTAAWAFRVCLRRGLLGRGTVLVALGIWAAMVAVAAGLVVLVWPTGTPSLNFYESLEAVEAVHGHGGLTRIVFD